VSDYSTNLNNNGGNILWF